MCATSYNPDSLKMSASTTCGAPPLEKHLSRCLAFVMTTMPLTLLIWGWQFWYLRPFILYASILPYLFVPIIFLSSAACGICALFGILEKAEFILPVYLNKFLWGPYMRIMHGYELIGVKNLPPKGKGGIIVFYHGVFPVDAVFAVVRISEYQGRLVGGTAHKVLFEIPLLGRLLQAYDFSADGREKMIEDLKKGALKAVSPGGDYETMFSENYSVHFGKRCGFAIAAKEAEVPIIPMFTENVREFQRCHFFGFKSLFRYMLEEHQLLTMWAFGGLPVKMKTHLGEPLYCGENETAQAFANRVKRAVEELRDAHQKMDNSMFRALMERFN